MSNAGQPPPANLLETRAVMEQAKGILMVTFRCSPGDAFELLCVAARGGGMKVHVLAAKLTELATHGGLVKDAVKDMASAQLNRELAGTLATAATMRANSRRCLLPAERG
jgi:ANTAR domain-containing protein